jgi:predicted DNA-binding protein (MmcQ/YjbR family)
MSDAVGCGGIAMDVDKIRAYCLAFPDATENLQWGDDLCFKVRAKIFAIVSLTSVPQKMCFKCTPETFAELIEREDIHPAPYVGRYKWVMLDRLDALRRDEIEDLIGQSYAMIAPKTGGAERRKSKGRLKRDKKTAPKPTTRRKPGAKKAR